jgi:hypothetical protein
MISLTYLSTATERFSDAELRDLLEDSRNRNHAVGLTGMLLYVGGHFIQTLEGPDGVVDATYERIARDSRHRDVFTALREETESRTFPDWSMGFESVSAEAAAVLPGFNDYLDTKTMSAESGRDLGRAGVFHRVFRDRMR